VSSAKGFHTSRVWSRLASCWYRGSVALGAELDTDSTSRSPRSLGLPLPQSLTCTCKARLQLLDMMQLPCEHSSARLRRLPRILTNGML